MQKKWLSIFVVMLMVAGLFVAGCKKPADKGAAPAGAPTTAEAPAATAAPAAPAAEQPAAPAVTPAAAEEPTEYTFAALCDKVVKETKATDSAAFTADMEKQTKDGCLTSAKKYEASPKAKEVAEAFTKVIFDNCKGKAGSEWVQCYASHGQAAGTAAANAMK